MRCDGIGAATAKKICAGWAAGRDTRASEKFLHDLGLTMAQASQVWPFRATSTLCARLHSRGCSCVRRHCCPQRLALSKRALASACNRLSAVLAFF